MLRMVKKNKRTQNCTLRQSHGKRPQSATPNLHLRNLLMLLHPPVTIPIAFVHGMLSGLQGRGPLGDECLADAGIARELLLQVAARVTSDQYVALFRLLVERLDDDVLCLLYTSDAADE